jgi:hypothetical protein
VHRPTEDKSDVMKDKFYEELQCVLDQFPKNHTKILVGGFNTKAMRENILKRTIGNESLHEFADDNGVRVVNFATSLFSSFLDVLFYLAVSRGFYL